MWLALILSLAAVAANNDLSETATLKLAVLGTEACARCSPNAYFMSVGPADLSQPTGALRKLRVTFHDCENLSGFTIEEVEIGRADSRSVVARYDANPGSLRPIYSGGLERRLPAYGGMPYLESVIWKSPSEFSVVTQQDTLLLHHLAGAEFEVTRRPRLQ